MFYFCIDYFMGCNYIHGPHLIYTIQRVCSFYHYHCYYYYYYNYNYFTIINIISLLYYESNIWVLFVKWSKVLCHWIYFFLFFYFFDLVSIQVWFFRDLMTFVVFSVSFLFVLSHVYLFTIYSTTIQKYQHELETLCETHYPNIKFHSFCILFFFFFCFFIH